MCLITCMLQCVDNRNSQIALCWVKAKLTFFGTSIFLLNSNCHCLIGNFSSLEIELSW